MTGPEYIAAVAATGVVIILLGCAVVVIAGLWYRHKELNKCDSCNGLGYHAIRGDDGRETGARYTCECRTVGSHFSAANS